MLCGKVLPHIVSPIMMCLPSAKLFKLMEAKKQKNIKNGNMDGAKYKAIIVSKHLRMGQQNAP